MVKLLAYVLALRVAITVNAQTSAQPGYVGCAAVSSVSTIGIADANIVGNAAICRTYCASSYTYAAYVVNHTTTTNCYCISSAKVSSITATSYTTANSNPCVTDDVALYDVAATTSTFGTCYSLGNVKSTSYSTPYGATVSSADSCLTKCKSNTAAFFIPYTSGGSNLFGCLCSSEVTMYTAIGTTCGQNTWYRYGNTGATTSGSVLKRKSLAASKKDKIRSAREKGYACPPGMIACQVDTHSGAWECVDDQNDILSCGGCMYGAFDQTIKGTLGVDCTSVPGVDNFAVTCTRGRCMAVRCKREHTLLNGQCHRNLNVSG